MIERLGRSDTMIEELTQTIRECEKKNIKLDIEKKKAAALKKFKEA